MLWVRSWSGLVNQVANYAKLASLMAPIRPFLSLRMRFTWNEELEDMLNKVEIMEAIRHRNFQPDEDCWQIICFLFQLFVILC